MKKLKLDLDRIQVESLEVEAAKDDRGTVQAHSISPCTYDGCSDTCKSCRPCPISSEDPWNC